jgi:hypothetical protein
MLGNRLDDKFIEYTEKYTNSLYYIIDPFLFRTIVNCDNYKDMCWSPNINKMMIIILLSRNMIFPIKYIKSPQDKDNVFSKFINNNNIVYTGIIDIKIEKNHSLLYFLFYLQDNKTKKYNLNTYSYNSNEIIFNQSLSSRRKWYYNELNIIYYLSKNIIKLYFYKIKHVDEYLISKFNFMYIK